MASSTHAARIAAAKARFGAFFREINDAFAEREDVVTQLALALLAREHVLLAGPPGTAKSALAGAVLGRIHDEETGQPSLYARQLTESTVQTDVIGPIDFKTLMETGRTAHFTDEGLLGAVHAFLDEVFDGRDMLLRSTLNLLHERELKQGTRITRGRFEVAVMTTNRYVAEVLESARETLLAFVDRIAFMGFVPRGFAAPSRMSAVLRHEVGGEARPALEAPLTVQDLDALQALAESVHVPDAICDGLARLLELFEAELGAAERADPGFLPTRYLSTRTAVRSGNLLRAICVHDGIFRRPDRPLSVEPDDLRMLRLHLLLSGPAPDEVAALLARERDPREKRQLTILRTEREAFERAFAKLPPIRLPPPRPAAGTGRPGQAGEAGEARDARDAKAAGEAREEGSVVNLYSIGGGAAVPPGQAGPGLAGAAQQGAAAEQAGNGQGPGQGQGVVDGLNTNGGGERSTALGPEAPLWAVGAASAFALGQPAAIAAALRDLSGRFALAGSPPREGRGAAPADAREAGHRGGASGEDAALAEALVRRGLALLERQALHVTLTARAEERAQIADVARDVAALADALDQGPGSAQALARWVRGRALVLLSTDAAAAPGLGQEDVIAWASDRDAATLLRDAEGRVSALEALAAERARLAAAGVEATLRHEADAAWHRGLGGVFEEITALCDAALRGAATAALAAGPRRTLGQLLDDLGAVLGRLRDLDGRAGALGLGASLRARVVGPRIAPLLAHTFGRVEVRDRRAYLVEVDRALRVLEGAGLGSAVPASEWLGWAARALLRADAATEEGPPPTLTHEGYRELRSRGARVPSGFVLAEVALRTGQGTGAASGPVGAASMPAEAGAAPVLAGAVDGLDTVSAMAAGPVVAGPAVVRVRAEARSGGGRESGSMQVAGPAAAALLGALPEELRREVAAADRARIERVVRFLERFWAEVAGPDEVRSPGAAAERLQRLVASRFFAILLDDGAASRTVLEIDLLAELFPEESEAAEGLRRRMDALVTAARRRVLALVRLRGEAAWAAALGEAASPESAA